MLERMWPSRAPAEHGERSSPRWSASLTLAKRARFPRVPSNHRPRALLPAMAIAAIAALAPAPARADLTDDATRLIEKWSAKTGTSIQHLSPIFLEHGHLTTVRLTPASAAPSASASAKPAPASPPASASPRATPSPPASKQGCTTIVLLTPRTAEIAFLTDAEDAQPIPPPSLPVAHPTLAPGDGGALHSKAGVATLERCGKEQAANPLENERLLVQSVTPRTAVEILVVRSAAPLEPVESLLPERAVGPSAPRGDAGRPIDPGPLADRLQRADKRAREAGAAQVFKVAMNASPVGTGQFVVKLSEGCHTLDVVADVPSGPARPTDVDAEAQVTEGGRALARDRGEATDAHLDFCVGEPTQVDVSFIGAAGPVPVTLVDAFWPLPAGIPTEWGPLARGDVAAALRRRHAPALPPEPIETIMGVQGETLAPFAVEPGQCYLAVVALVRGEARALKAAVEIGDRAPHDEIADRPEAAQISFCATTEDRAALRIEARGPQPWWVALLWRVTP